MEIANKPARYDQKEVEAIQLLPVHQSVFISALVAPSISSLLKETAVSSIYTNLKAAELHSGLTRMDNKDLVMLATTSYSHILDRYPALTVAEFETASRQGSINEFGQWYGMCLKSVNQWVKGYLTQEQRLAAIKEWNKAIGITSDKPVKFTDEMLKRSALNAFEEYKKDKKIPWFPHAVYDIINESEGFEMKHPEKGIINVLITDRARAKEIYNAAVFEFKSELENKNKRSGGVISKELSQITEDLNGNRSFEFLLKKKYLVEYFENKIKQSKTQ